MVAREKLQHEEIVEKAGEKFNGEFGSQFRVQTDLSRETKEEINTESVSRGIVMNGAVARKVQVDFMKLKKLRKCQEEQAFTLRLPIIGKEDHIGGAERDSAVTTIKSMQRFYNYSSDTLAAAVNYLDRFVSKVKVKRKYLSCVASASFYLSTKMNEEEEFHPTASDLSSLNRRSWQPSDLKRMEKILLDKLGWNLFPAVTCLSYLEIIYAMLKLLNHDIENSFFKKLVERSELYMNYSQCAFFNACTLAVAVAQQCLKEEGLCSVINNYVLYHIQAVCQVTDSELFDCHCAILKHLQIYSLHPEMRPKCLPLPRIVPRASLVKRPSFYGTTDLPTIEEVQISNTDESSDSWSSESSEEEDSCVPCHIVNFLPPVGNQPPNMSQSYCRLLDQCCVDDRLYFRPPQCNSTPA